MGVNEVMTMNKELVVKVREDGSSITLYDVQMKLLKILIEFDRICKKHNIDYALSYGTVLGAVRHHGFIPWDDDVDVMMTYENYDKLLRVIDKEKKENFYYHSNDNDSLYNATLCEMKFRIKDTEVKEKNFLLKNRCQGDGLFLDVFIIDSVSENPKLHNKVRRKSVFYVLYLVMIDLLKFDAHKLKLKYRKIGRKYAQENKDSKYVGMVPTWVYDGFKDDRLDKSIIFPFINMEFEGYSFPVPHDPHAYCKQIYGETYMEFPSKENQVPKHIADITL